MNASLDDLVRRILTSDPQSGIGLGIGYLTEVTTTTNRHA